MGHTLVQNPFCLVTIDLWSPVPPYLIQPYPNVTTFWHFTELGKPLLQMHGFLLDPVCLQQSDMLSRHWDHPTVYIMIHKLLNTRGNSTVIPREATQEKEKENLKMQPEKVKKEEKEE